MKLAKMLIAAMWVLSVALASAAQADPPAAVGRLNYVSGAVSFAPAEAPDEWAAAALNRPITIGDRLWTDQGARAEMHVGSLAVRMGGLTSMDVLNLDDRGMQVRVAQGDVSLRVRRLTGNRSIEIDTPTGAVIVHQPGSYRISVDADGTSSFVTVRNGGEAEVFTANSSVLVRNNEEAEISGARAQLFAASPLDDFDQWAATRDRRLDRVASTRYVPVEMTGYEDLDQYGEWRTVAEYGPVWYPRDVSADWAPYRDGHWVWVSPWGWTWVDAAPWGFAPFHYGRWVWVDQRWAWTPGRLVERPVYAPALVAFIGGSNFSVSIASGASPAVAWVPLGYREPYIPWYTASRTYVQNVNITHVTNVNVTNIRYVNRSVPTGVTVVSRDNFVSARDVRRARLDVPTRTLAAAPITRTAPVSQPIRQSFVRSQPGPRPPAQVSTREAIAVNTPPAPVRQAVREDGRAPRVATSEERPQVRVINRQARTNVPVNETPRAATRQTQPRAAAPAEARPPQPIEQQRVQEQLREQRGEQQREQRREEDQVQKAQAQQQADQLERERKQRAGQEEQQRQKGRAQQESQQQQKAAQDERERGQKAAQEQRQRQEQERALREQQQQKGAQEERERGQKAAQERQRQEEQRGQQEQQRQRQAAQQEQQRALQEQQRQQQAAQQQAAQKAQQEQQRAQQAAQQQAAQKAQQEQQRALQEQQRQQQAAQQQAAQKVQQEQQRAQQQAAQQQAAQKAQQEQRQQQAAQQQAAQKAQQEQQRQAAQQAAKAPQEQPRPQDSDKGKRGRKDKDQPES